MIRDRFWPAIAILLPVAMALHAGIGAGDVAYLLRLGDGILHGGGIPHTDYMSFLAAGRPWTDQQWGTEVLFSALFAAGGWFTLALFYGLIVGVIAYLLYRTCRIVGMASRPAAVLAFLGMTAAYATLSLRAQLLAALLFMFTSWLLVQRHQHPRRLWALPVVAALWANIHGTFFLLLLLCGLAWLEEMSKPARRGMRLFLVGVVSGAATLANPAGFGVWRYLFNQTTSATVSGITSEWQPPTLHTADGILFFVSVAAVVAYLARRRAAVAWPRLLTLGIFLGMALLAERNELWWALSATVVLAGVAAAVPGKSRWQAVPLMDGIAALAVMVFVVASVPWSLLGRAQGVPGPYIINAPQGISRQLAQLLRPGERIFNAQAWGSWLEFTLPANPVATDSIIEANSAANWDAYFQAGAAEPGWQAILRRWGVKAAAVSAADQGPLLRAMGADPGWRLAYRNGDGAIFLSTT